MTYQSNPLITNQMLRSMFPGIELDKQDIHLERFSPLFSEMRIKRPRQLVGIIMGRNPNMFYQPENYSLLSKLPIPEGAVYHGNYEYMQMPEALLDALESMNAETAFAVSLDPELIHYSLYTVKEPIL